MSKLLEERTKLDHLLGCSADDPELISWLIEHTGWGDVVRYGVAARPDWTNSIDAAYRLPVDIGTWELSTVPKTHAIGRAEAVAKLYAYNPNLSHSNYTSKTGLWVGQAHRLPMAMVRAWLQYDAAVHK